MCVRASGRTRWRAGTSTAIRATRTRAPRRRLRCLSVCVVFDCARGDRRRDSRRVGVCVFCVIEKSWIDCIDLYCLHSRHGVMATRALRAAGSRLFFAAAFGRSRAVRWVRCASASASDAPLSVVSWNVNGLRALLKKAPDALDALARDTQADVLVLQETKLGANGEADVAKVEFLRDYGTRAYATSAARKGYSGVAVFVRDALKSEMRDVTQTTLDAGDFDIEGRTLTCELDSCYVVNAYVPNSGDGLKRLEPRIDIWERAIKAHIKKLEATGKPVVYCGDMNVAHEEIDLWGNHAQNAKSAGYTPQERAAMSELLRDCDLVDTFRAFKGPNAREFSYWSYRGGARAAGKGWRLDYILAPAKLSPNIVDAYILPNVTGSDHAPVGVKLHV